MFINYMNDYKLYAEFQTESTIARKSKTGDCTFISLLFIP